MSRFGTHRCLFHGATSTVAGDTTAPTILDVTATNANGTYGSSDTLHITVQFSEPVIVSGTPKLHLKTGRTDHDASYASGSGTDTLTFDYTPSAGDNSLDLDYLSVNALILNGGTIQDGAANNATLTLASPGGANSLGSNKDLVIAAMPANTNSVKMNGATATLVNITPTGVSFSNTAPFTLSGWFKGAGGVFSYLVRKVSPGSSGYYFFIGNGYFEVQLIGVGVGNYIYGHSNNGASANTWTHFALTKSSVSDISGFTYYVNGVAKAIITDHNALISTSASSDPLIIGQDVADAYPSPNIDHVAIFNAELSAAEVAALITSNKPANLYSHSKAANLVSWYWMGEDTDSTSTIFDRKGSNDLTATSITINADVP